jgi:hypothetical protein
MHAILAAFQTAAPWTLEKSLKKPVCSFGGFK